MRLSCTRSSFVGLLAALALAFLFIGCPDTSSTDPTTFTVTFDSQGGSAVASQSVVEGQAAQEPQAPTRAGHTFAGWYISSTNQTESNLWNFDTPITANRTLYARWVTGENVQMFTITFNSNGGSAVAPITNIPSGDTVSLRGRTTTKAGYVFSGWFRDEGLTQSAGNAITVTANITLYARWVDRIEDTSVQGFWEREVEALNTKVTFNFRADGEGTFYAFGATIPFAYTITNDTGSNRLTIENSYHLSYSISGETLTFTDVWIDGTKRESITYTKLTSAPTYSGYGGDTALHGRWNGFIEGDIEGDIESFSTSIDFLTTGILEFVQIVRQDTYSDKNIWSAKNSNLTLCSPRIGDEGWVVPYQISGTKLTFGNMEFNR